MVEFWGLTILIFSNTWFMLNQLFLNFVFLRVYFVHERKKKTALEHLNTLSRGERKLEGNTFLLSSPTPPSTVTGLNS